MATEINYRAWLVGAAIGLLLALCILPSTGPLLRLQIEQVLGSQTGLPGTKPLPASIAMSRPNDVQIQIATAIGDFQSSYSISNDFHEGPDFISPFTRLESRFPNEPSVYANTLRMLFMRRHMRHRPENSLAFGLKLIPDPGAAAVDQFPYAFFDKTAMTGERLDPNNAYFSMLYAASLFSQNKDAAAMAEYHLASLKPYWREYYTDEANGNCKKWDLALGVRSAMMHEALFASILLPHYAPCREVARIELYKAMLAERSGNVKQGLEVRQDIMRCGSLMRSQSTAIIGTLVGAAIFRTGLVNLGGRPDSTEDSDIYSDQVSQQRIDDFCRYLRRTGNGDLVAPVTEEYDAGTFIHNTGLDNLQNATVGVPSLAVLWAADFLILADVIMLLLLGGLGTVALRILKLSPMEPVSRSHRLPLITGLVLGLGVYILSVTPSRDAIVASLIFAIPFILSIVWICRGCGRQRALRRLLALFAVGAAVFIFLTIAFFEFSKCNGAVQLGQAIEYGTPVGIASQVLKNWEFVGGVLFAFPLMLVCLVLLGLSIIRRLPLFTGILTGLSKTAAPVACVLILVYGVVFLGTISQERVVNTQVDQQTVCEGRFNAAMTGHTWPGPTNWKIGSKRPEEAPAAP